MHKLIMVSGMPLEQWRFAMTVILVLITLLVFALVDYLLNRYKVPVTSVVMGAAPPTTVPTYVDGFLLPDTLRYHAGHTWLVRERPHLVRVGVDEFAAKLAGRIEKLELPCPGQWIRQGQTAWNLFRKGERASMISPIEGEIVETNEELMHDPSLMRRDPYGKGWLMTVHVPDEESTWRNLLPARLVRSWMRESVARLYACQPALAGAVAADGGRPVDDLLDGLPGTEWPKVTAQFFLP
jgi:glycine cleavage system H lipoate-binding protein